MLPEVFGLSAEARLRAVPLKRLEEGIGRAAAPLAPSQRGRFTRGSKRPGGSRGLREATPVGGTTTPIIHQRPPKQLGIF